MWLRNAGYAKITLLTSLQPHVTSYQLQSLALNADTLESLPTRTVPLCLYNDFFFQQALSFLLQKLYDAVPHLCGIGQDSAAKSSPCQCTSKSSGPNRSSRLLEGVLGMLVGVLALLLIGTIIGWMTTWQRMKDRYISSSVK